MIGVPSKQHTFVEMPESQRVRILTVRPHPEQEDLPYWNRYPVENVRNEMVGVGLFDIVKKIAKFAKPIVGPTIANIPAIIEDIQTPSGTLPATKLKRHVVREMKKTAKRGIQSVTGPKIAKAITGKFLPGLFRVIKRLLGIRSKRAYGSGVRRAFQTKVTGCLHRCARGGAIGAVLSTLASILPVAFDIGKKLLPGIKKFFGAIFKRRRRRRRGRGKGAAGIVKTLGTALSKFIKKMMNGDKMSGSGFVSFIKMIAKPFAKLFGKLFSFGKKLLPLAKKAVPLIKKGLKFVPKKIRRKVFGSINNILSTHLGIKSRVQDLPKLMRIPEIEKSIKLISEGKEVEFRNHIKKSAVRAAIAMARRAVGSSDTDDIEGV